MVKYPGRVLVVGFCIWLIGLGPIRPYLTSFISQGSPKAILVLGGDVERERVGAILARELSLPLLVSGGSNPEHASWLISQAGISESQVQFDYRAQDTLSNFTSLADDLFRQQINHLLLVTSEDHLPRAMAVGRLVAGSRGIRLTPIAVSCRSKCVEESRKKIVFDSMRAFVWVITGRDLKAWTKRRLPGIFDSQIIDIN